jgi:hypothetical protein
MRNSALFDRVRKSPWHSILLERAQTQMEKGQTLSVAASSSCPMDHSSLFIHVDNYSRYYSLRNMPLPAARYMLGRPGCTGVAALLSERLSRRWAFASSQQERLVSAIGYGTIESTGDGANGIWQPASKSSAETATRDDTAAGEGGYSRASSFPFYSSLENCRALQIYDWGVGHAR